MNRTNSKREELRIHEPDSERPILVLAGKDGRLLQPGLHHLSGKSVFVPPTTTALSSVCYGVNT